MSAFPCKLVGNMTSTLTTSQSSSLSDLFTKTEQLIYLRFAFAGVGLVITLSFAFFNIAAFEFLPIGSTIAFIIFYTAMAFVTIVLRRRSERNYLRRMNLFLIVLDVISLTTLVHFTGGLESDLYVLYLLPILLSSYTTGRRGTYVAATFVSLSYVASVVLENAETIPYLMSTQSGTLSSAYVSKLWAKILGRSILLVTVSFIWARFCGYMSGLARRGENKLREQLEYNRGMVYEIQAKAKREKLINTVNSALRNTNEFDKILETAADELARALSIFRCAIVCKLDSVGETYICEANAEREDEDGPAKLKYFDATICNFLLKHKANYETATDGSVQKTFLFSEPAENPFFANIKETMEESGLASIVVQPMVYGDKSKGVIILAETDPRRQWADSELELVKSVAGQVAVAIQQVTLIDELSKKNKDLMQKNINLDLKNSELRTMQSQLIHQEKMASLGRLVAGIAHELNNPINFVHGNLPYLKEYVTDLRKLIDSVESAENGNKGELSKLKEEIKYDFLITDLDNILADLNEGADRIRHIVRNLKSFSRLDEAELKDASIVDGIESTLKILSQYYGRDKIKVVKKFGEVPTVLCYPGQLNQLWMNLLSNAAQALDSTEEPAVTIETRGGSEQVVVTISDNGPGIPPEIQSKIFDPFYTTKPVGQGTGLGLSICHSIVERHGGQILLDSSPGEGTSFTVKIPVHRKPEDLERFKNNQSIYEGA